MERLAGANESGKKFFRGSQDKNVSWPRAMGAGGRWAMEILPNAHDAVVSSTTEKSEESHELQLA